MSSVFLKLCQLYLLVKGYINSTNLTPNKKTIHEYKPSGGIVHERKNHDKNPESRPPTHL